MKSKVLTLSKATILALKIRSDVRTGRIIGSQDNDCPFPSEIILLTKCKRG